MLKSQSGVTDKGGASAVSLIAGEECDGGRSEEEAVLSIMDTTLHLPERIKLPHNDGKGRIRAEL